MGNRQGASTLFAAGLTARSSNDELQRDEHVITRVTQFSAFDEKERELVEGWLAHESARALLPDELLAGAQELRRTRRVVLPEHHAIERMVAGVATRRPSC